MSGESCSINVGTRTFNSFQLRNLVYSTDISDPFAVIHGLQDQEFYPQYETTLKLFELQKQGRELRKKINTSFNTGNLELELEESADQDIITIQQLMLSDIFDEVSSGSRFNLEEYKAHTIQQLQNTEGLTEEQARKKVEILIDNWMQIAKDSAALHKAIQLYNEDETKFEELCMQDEDIKPYKLLLSQLHASITNSLNTFIQKGILMKGCRIVNGLNLVSEMKDLDKKLFGHIDKIIIDKYNDVYIINYKFTEGGFKLSTTKLENCRYQMALLTEMLAKKGINVRNIKSYVIPVKLTYSTQDDSLQNLKKVSVDSPFNLSISNNRNRSTKHLNTARHFIDAPIQIKTSMQDVNAVKKQIDCLFSSTDIAADGVTVIPKAWIARNRSKIKVSNSPEYAYEVNFGENDTAYIKSSAPPSNNQEIFEEIIKRQNDLLEDDDSVVRTLVKNVRAGINGEMFNLCESGMFGKAGYFLNNLFGQYFKKDKDAPQEYEFIRNDVLNSCNIILIKKIGKNGMPDQIDVFRISGFDLDQKVNLKRTSQHIFGDILSQLDPKVKESIKYKPTYGNIEALVTMLLLNQVLPKISGDFTLGSVNVVSTNYTGQYIPYSARQLNTELFSTATEVLNDFSELTVNNNFSNQKFVDPIDLVVEQFRNIISDPGVYNSEVDKYEDMGFDDLLTVNSKEAKLTLLRSLAKKLVEDKNWLENFEAVRRSKNGSRWNILYRRILEAIAYYDVGEVSSVEEKMSFADSKGMISSRIRNKNVQLVTELYTRTINEISEKVHIKWEPIRQVFFQFYKDMGYSTTRNAVRGDLVRIFDDLYAQDERGERTLRLLNPYDNADMAQIKDKREIKRKFLKRVLFEFAKVRYPQKGIAFNFKNENDPDLQEFINRHRQDYFNIPLTRASKSTRNVKMSVKEKWKDTARLAVKIIKHPKAAFEELYNDVANPDERNYYEDAGIGSLQVRNKFWKGDDLDERDNYIAQQGVNYFETNLESLLIDYIEKDIQTKGYQKALLTIKGVILQLDLLKGSPNLKAIAEQTIKEIEDYVKVNVFNTSIMSKLSQQIMAILAIPKRIVSDTLIGGHVVGGVRDVFQGTWENMLRVIVKFDTKLSAKSLNKAYVEVTKNVFKNARSINIINQLCQIYRISNVDVARISEGLKTDRGMANFKTWLYASLRRPDFLNRMVMFVAHCMEDGVYDAFDIKDGRLVYDWKKDKRFSIFAAGKTSDPKYKEQMGAYYNAVRAYNADHPDATIGFNPFEEGATPLPMPYSFNDVENIKKVANNIYGSYDRSTRQGIENIFIGQTFGMFATWMNGIYANWFTKPGTYSTGQFEMQQAKDDQGNLLYFDIMGNVIVQRVDTDGNVKYYYDGTDTEVTEGLDKIVPVMDKVPIPIQGIFYTLKECGKALKNGDFKEEIWQNDVNKANLKRLMAELLAWLIFGTIYKCVLTPGFKEFKKGMKERDILTNAITELIYKSSSSSYDSFKGLYNIIDFVGNADGTPIYKQNNRLLMDLGKVALGDKGFFDAFKGNIAIFKNFQYSISAEMKK